MPLPLLQLKNKSLIMGQILTEEYTYVKIDDTVEPQNCSAIVSIREPYKYFVSKNFSIVTNPSFSFNILTCRGESCTEKTKVFAQGEDIFLSYYSEVQNPSLTAVLTYPDMTTQQIGLPTAIKADQIGTYVLEVTASKEGYKIVTISDQFGVIKKEAKIETISGMQMVSGTKENEPKNIETQAAGNETKAVEEIQKDNSIFVITTFAMFIILVIIVISLIFRKKTEKVEYYYSKPTK